MAHDHHHHDDDTYFIDQLSMVALAGAFGVTCLCLYFIQTSMLRLLLGEQFHLFVAISGFVLVGLAIVRAATLWREARPATATLSLPVVESHSHDGIQPAESTRGVAADHHHHHHEGCSHDHDHGDCGHDHSHDHGHGHSHDHSHDDHEHGWAPWRYVVMLVPIMLFLLGLPNKGPQAAYVADTAAREAEARSESIRTASLVGLDPWSRLGMLAKIAGDNSFADAIPFVSADKFSVLLNSPNDPEERADLQDKVIKLRGVFVADPRDPRIFSLVRFKIGCCGADAVPSSIAVFAREPVSNVKQNAWAEVSGKVEYGKRGSGYVVRLVTAGSTTVKECNQDPYPYIK